MKAINRQYFLKVRVNAEERATAQHKAREQGISLSDFFRQRILNYRLRNHALEKEKILHLARISSNLNQIARHVNTYKENLSKLELLLALSQIDEELKKVQKCI